MNNLRIKIAGVAIAALLVVMTLSDWYYSKLENEYPVLDDQMEIHGIVRHCKVHWKHAYVSLDQGQKVNIPPPESIDNDRPFHSVIEEGDSLFKTANSEKITLIRNGKRFVFLSHVR